MRWSCEALVEFGPDLLNVLAPGTHRRGGRRCVSGSVQLSVRRGQGATDHVSGLAVVPEALDDVSETGERCVEAELPRLRAELLRMQGSDDQAEADLCQALAIAREQQARWWQLRATLDLCRLWKSQGKQHESHRMLAETFGWFTEGFDSSDL